jgi:hypothetical protein
MAGSYPGGYSFGGGGSTMPAMAATLAPPDAGGSENIRTLIAMKERELHDINEYRLQSLEALMTEKVWRAAYLCTRCGGELLSVLVTNAVCCVGWRVASVFNPLHSDARPTAYAGPGERRVESQAVQDQRRFQLQPQGANFFFASLLLPSQGVSFGKPAV